MADTMGSAQRTRAWWFDRHGLNPRHAPKTIRDCLHRAGWLPTAGSTGVYLSIRARRLGSPVPRSIAAILTRRDTVPVLDTARKPVAIRDVSIMHNHAIVAGGELVGVWEYDPAAKRVVTRVWHTDGRLGARVAVAADETSRFIREHIGDAKISAVDPPARRARRIAFCRAWLDEELTCLC